MSFTTDVINEISQIELQKTCCRKAMLLGLLYGASVEDRRVTARLRDAKIADTAAQILSRQFSSTPQVAQVSAAGRRFTEVAATSKAVAAFLQSLDRGSDKPLSELVGFRCEDCAGAFLRGAFIATATVSDPEKGYHLEFALPTLGRADALATMLETEIGHAGRITRGSRHCVYYKRNGAIGDLLYYIGALKLGFVFSDGFIAHSIKNMVNRTTNCEAKNLSRVVDASFKHIEAITWLEKEGTLDELPDEMRETARLRVENPEAPLSELAAMHRPPISRSALNRRLTKMVALYEKGKQP